MTGVSVDDTGCFVASCADDGSVVVSESATPSGGWEPVDTHPSPRPLRALAIDPAYARRGEQLVVSGGCAGELSLLRRGWFGKREHTALHHGEGTISRVAWCAGTTLLAWANEHGVKVMDVERGEPITFVERPPSSRHVDAEGCRCALHWAGEGELLIGWADVVMVLEVHRPPPVPPATAGAGEPGGGAGAPPPVTPGSAAAGPARSHAEVVAALSLDCIVCGISPFDRGSVAVLGYTLEGEDYDDDADTPSQGGDAPAGGSGGSFSSRRSRNAELSVWSLDSGERVAADALPLIACGDAPDAIGGGYELCTSYATATYRGAHRRWSHADWTPPPADTAADGGASADDAITAAGRLAVMRGTPPVLYVCAPQDVVVARARDVDDLVDDALASDRFADALALALAHRAPPSAAGAAGASAADAATAAAAAAARARRARVPLHELVILHVEGLMARGAYEMAAAQCAALIGGDGVVGAAGAAGADGGPGAGSATTWERWIAAFDARGRVSAIAPHVPTRAPRLRAAVYERVLEALLRASPEGLRDTLRRWGHPARPGDAAGDLYSLPGLMTRLGDEMRGPRRAPPAVVEAMAELLVLDGQPMRALEYYLQLPAGDENGGDGDGDGADDGDAPVEESDRSTAAGERRQRQQALYRLVVEHRLFAPARASALRLVRALGGAGGELAAKLLVKHVDQLPIDAVCAQLDAHAALQRWYLHLMFERCGELYNRAEYRSLHELQVRLYARERGDDEDAAGYEKVRAHGGGGGGADESDLLRFLRWSRYVEPAAALRECYAQAPPLYIEIVHILGGMGQTRDALGLLLGELRDARRAIEFVEAHDRELWPELIRHAVGDREFLRGMLDHAGEYSSELPARLIAEIPPGMRVPGLREKLANIVADYRFQVTLHAACIKALEADGLALQRRQHQLQRRGVRVAPSAALSALGMSEAAARRSEGDAAVVQLLRDGTIQPHSADVQEPRTGAGADAGEFSEV